ncbi:MAG TPA: formate dehydrogenase, partial [Kribbella sp.]
MTFSATPISKSVRVFVPRDAAARSVGADEVAERIVAAATANGVAVEVVRNGSRGMLWLEPLVEVETLEGRVGYGPVAPEDIDGLVAAGMLTGGGRGEGAYLGLVEELPWMQRQQRLTFARVGVIDPRSADDHAQYKGNAGLKQALAMTPSEVVEEVVNSGLRGRGGAGFPTGIKWRTVLAAESELKFVCCNADEGDSGTFADRMLIEGDPFTLIEGMTIAAYAVGATEGYVYLR